ncbi:AcrR family transcriptional regulator [Sphingobium sp. OAS761]|uniref:TetR/AcrR family transcriptional regulator n=1 Tax=Sphingobium sp. OAS761 TaxID=2817901 RepID=UPI0020A15680|nr:TetR family transcriptional regulator [Sphingobium sp. OAS761]MCP1470380.1 AcrR family transcriptional regulator [Sphingobium sp. OAS761]
MRSRLLLPRLVGKADCLYTIDCNPAALCQPPGAAFSPERFFLGVFRLLMAASRLSAAGRRASIITAAKGVFARYGLEGARTQQIARAAGVSEALLFRHFPTKTHIYRAVLREVISDQNASFRAAAAVKPNTQGLLEMIRDLVSHAMRGAEASNATGMRMVVGSLAGDGNYARLVYRRALRLSLPRLELALKGAQEDGGLTGEVLSPPDIAAFLEHIGTMMMMARCHERTAVPYDDSEDRVMRDAMLFCARGLGIAEDRILAFLA